MLLIQQGGGVSASTGPLKAFAVCSKIWNHPDVYYHETRAQESATVQGSKVTGGESSCKLDWLPAQLPGYQPGCLDNSPKMSVLFDLIDKSVHFGDRMLVFSQNLSTLAIIEKLLSQRLVPMPHGRGNGNVQYQNTNWHKNKHFCRLDGSTGSIERDKLINNFNSPSNTDCWVFLLSTKAGCLGINLVGANRVVVLDVSWNPCYDAQAVCRVYRYGQTKPCFIYRLVCDGTMERKIYDRQISKQGMSDRVVDHLQPERHLSTQDIISLTTPLTALPPQSDLSSNAMDYSFDPLLRSLCCSHGQLLTKLPFKHESLLVDSEQERMTEVEKYLALTGFQAEWRALRSGPASIHEFRAMATRNANITPAGITPIGITPTGITPTGITVTGINATGIMPAGSTPSISVKSTHLTTPPNTLAKPTGISAPAPVVSTINKPIEIICLDSDEEPTSAKNTESAKFETLPSLLPPETQALLTSANVPSQQSPIPQPTTLSGSQSGLRSAPPPVVTSAQLTELSEDIVLSLKTQLLTTSLTHCQDNENKMATSEELRRKSTESLPPAQNDSSVLLSQQNKPMGKTASEGVNQTSTNEEKSGAQETNVNLNSNTNNAIMGGPMKLTTPPDKASWKTKPEKKLKERKERHSLPWVPPDPPPDISAKFPPVNIPLLCPDAANLLFLSTGVKLPSSPPEDVLNYPPIVSPAPSSPDSHEDVMDWENLKEDEVYSTTQTEDGVLPMVCSPLPLGKRTNQIAVEKIHVISPEKREITEKSVNQNLSDNVQTCDGAGDSHVTDTHVNGLCDSHVSGSCDSHVTGLCDSHVNGSCDSHVSGSCDSHVTAIGERGSCVSDPGIEVVKLNNLLAEIGTILNNPTDIDGATEPVPKQLEQIAKPAAKGGHKNAGSERHPPTNGPTSGQSTSREEMTSKKEPTKSTSETPLDAKTLRDKQSINKQSPVIPADQLDGEARLGPTNKPKWIRSFSESAVPRKCPVATDLPSPSMYDPQTIVCIDNWAGTMRGETSHIESDAIEKSPKTKNQQKVSEEKTSKNRHVSTVPKLKGKSTKSKEKPTGKPKISKKISPKSKKNKTKTHSRSLTPSLTSQQSAEIPITTPNNHTQQLSQGLQNYNGFTQALVRNNIVHDVVSFPTMVAAADNTGTLGQATPPPGNGPPNMQRTGSLREDYLGGFSVPGTSVNYRPCSPTLSSQQGDTAALGSKVTRDSPTPVAKEHNAELYSLLSSRLQAGGGGKPKKMAIVTPYCVSTAKGKKTAKAPKLTIELPPARAPTQPQAVRNGRLNNTNFGNCSSSSNYSLKSPLPVKYVAPVVNNRVATPPAVTPPIRHSPSLRDSPRQFDFSLAGQPVNNTGRAWRVNSPLATPTPTENKFQFNIQSPMENVPRPQMAWRGTPSPNLISHGNPEPQQRSSPQMQFDNKPVINFLPAQSTSVNRPTNFLSPPSRCGFVSPTPVSRKSPVISPHRSSPSPSGFLSTFHPNRLPCNQTGRCAPSRSFNSPVPQVRAIQSLAIPSLYGRAQQNGGSVHVLCPQDLPSFDQIQPNVGRVEMTAAHMCK